MINSKTQVTQNNGIKRERFIRVVESRVNKILYNLDNLSRCSNKRNYEYTDEEVRKIFREVERKVKETKLTFQEFNSKKKKFVLRS